MKDKKDTVTTSQGTSVSLKQAKHHFDKKIKGLPKKEVRILNVKYSQYRRYLGSLSGRKSANGRLMSKEVREKKDEIIGLFGRMYSINEVIAYLKEEYKLDASITFLRKLRLENVDAIRNRIEKHQADYSNLRLSHKSSRIEELSGLYYKLKEKYNTDPRSSTLNSLTNVIEAIRKETDGDILTINGIIDIDLRAELDLHFRKTVLETINVQQVIIGMTSASMGINPERLQYELSRGYYRKLDKLQGTGNYDPTNTEFVYPSETQDSFEELLVKNKQYENKVESVQDGKDKKRDKKKKKRKEKNSIENFRKKLLDKLNVQKERVKTKKDALISQTIQF